MKKKLIILCFIVVFLLLAGGAAVFVNNSDEKKSVATDSQATATEEPMQEEKEASITPEETVPAAMPSEEITATPTFGATQTPAEELTVTPTAALTPTPTMTPTPSKAVVITPKIILSYTSMSLKVGAARQLSVSFMPANSHSIRDVVWNTSNDEVATVKGGYITAKSSGSATITAKCGNLSATCKVMVSEDVNKLSISSNAVTLDKGQSVRLSVKVPSKVVDKNSFVSWSSFDNKVASVKDGVITATGAGTTTIFCSYDTQIVSCSVTVKAPVTGIRTAQSHMNIVVGTTEKCMAHTVPFDATEKKTISYSSDDESVAVVDSEGNITGIAAGTCVITADCGNAKACINVSVLENVNVENLSFTDSVVTIRSDCKSLKLGYNCNAGGAVPNFASSNESVVTIDSTGCITGVKEGTANITMSLGGRTATCKVVVEKIYIITIDPGHDSTHTGASSAGYREEILNKKVADACKAYLENNYKNVSVYLSRNTSCLNTNNAVDMFMRVQNAQDRNSDLFVSMHFNAGGGRGVMILISQYYTIAKSSKALGNCILSKLHGLGIPYSSPSLLIRTSQTGTKDPQGRVMDYYSIIKNCAIRNMTGVLIEHCYIDSSADRKFFNSEEAVNNLGKADAQGIAEYLKLVKK